jgi:hypothetical protein
MAGDAIITDSGAMHVAGVPIVNPSTIVVWEVTPGPGNGFQTTPKTCITSGVPPVIPPNWAGFAPLAAYLFSWQDYLLSQAKQGNELTDNNISDAVPLFCSPVSNFSAYVSPKAAAQSTANTTWGSGVTAVAFDPTRGGSVITVVIVEGMHLVVTLSPPLPLFNQYILCTLLLFTVIIILPTFITDSYLMPLWYYDL